MTKRKVAVRRKMKVDSLNFINGELQMNFPIETVKRIRQHCDRHNIPIFNFLKKAVYDALPVYYEVDKQFVFPFGKYTGETAGSVQEFDPDYLTWCCKNISGFTLTEEMRTVPPEVEKRHTQHEEYKQQLRTGESLHYGIWRDDNTRKVFARRITSWGESRWRFLGTQIKE